MAFQHGKGSAVLLDEFDLSSDLTQYNWGFSIQLPNVTTFGNNDKVFLGGINEGRINAQGVYNTALTDTELVAADGSAVVVSASPQGFIAIGDRAHMVHGRLENYQPRAPYNDAVRFSSGLMGSAGAYLGVTLHSNTQRSSTSTGYASVDGGAQTTNGATAFLHVTQFDGTNATITIEDSSDDAIFGSLVAFGQVTGVGSEKVTVAGTVEQYARVSLAGTFTTLTFIVTYKKHLK